MNKFRLIVDSSCDLPEDFNVRYNIGVADLIVNFNGQLYLDRKEITASDIIAKYEATHVYPKTAALNIAETEEIFKRELKDYDHIFYLPVSLRNHHFFLRIQRFTPTAMRIEYKVPEALCGIHEFLKDVLNPIICMQSYWSEVLCCDELLRGWWFSSVVDSPRLVN